MAHRVFSFMRYIPLQNLSKPGTMAVLQRQCGSSDAISLPKMHHTLTPKRKVSTKEIRLVDHHNKSLFSELQLVQNFVTRRWKSINPYPPLIEEDIEEQFVRGSGPGGQSVNKSMNQVVLVHKPTGIVVKCHETRSLHENRKKARRHMQERLDLHYNGSESLILTQKREDSKKLKERKRRTNLKLEMKRAFKAMLKEDTEKTREKDKENS